jgi:hypothetical protein
MKDSLNQIGTASGLGGTCHFCHKFSHRMDKCPLINFVLNKKRVISQNEKSEDQPRNS